MNKELQMWRRSYQTYLEKYEEEKEATIKLLEPLSTQLKEVEANIAEQIKRNHAVKGEILRNEASIVNLLEQQSMVEQN